ncbi:NAD(P)-dependent oxidoreductase [Ostreibacterium oceani]|uniref:Hydroxyacid dehydrogenase n=1 Tax=Ostreibacterium oceani TaxID=2654998 RepID=A0A6N7EUX8_9GAMM|nr:NAD(P)-dependent oxidoreductase [Ostreibacterium oceani]MPV85239.1 hydroxyacid dehydrogenase [Ostreibacterium oceani]
MKILFADKFPAAQQAALAAEHTLTNSPALDEHSLVTAIGDADILVVRSTKVSAEAIDAATQLKLIIRAGAGTNTIDKAHAAEKGIAVCNTPGKNAIAVAELAMGLMLAADRHIADATQDLKSGQWNKKRYSVADGIYGKSVGIIGFGAIGQAFAERALAFGMSIHTVIRTAQGSSSLAQQRLTDQFPGLTQHPDLASLARHCDVISLHVPFNEHTKQLIDAEFLSQMKPNSLLINTSRGEVVDEAALLAALDEKPIKAALDVFCNEPSAATGEFNSPLASHPQVIGTHHIGASTEQAQTAVADNVVEIIASFANHQQFLNRVN